LLRQLRQCFTIITAETGMVSGFYLMTTSKDRSPCSQTAGLRALQQPLGKRFPRAYNRHIGDWRKEITVLKVIRGKGFY
jgi:hypothetical protein